MTETPSQERTDGPDDGTEQTQRIDTEHLRDYRTLRRSLTDRKVAGVAGGLGRHLNIDPTVLRVAFVVLCFFGGAGFVLYGAAWLLVPEDGESRSVAATSEGTRNTLLIVAAVLAALLFLGDSFGGFGFPWPLAIIALVVFVVLMNRDKPMQTTYEDPSTPAPPAWAPPAAPAYQAPPPRPDRGPKLFGITVALLAIALGVLWLFDLGGDTVAAGAYPALALAVVGVMLLVAAWVGRGGGLILLGLVAALALALTSLSTPDWDGDRRLEATPGSTAEVRDRYSVPAGRVFVDLTEVSDLEELDGRSIAVEANAGELVVVIPDGLDVSIDAEVAAAGEVQLLDESYNGVSIDATEFVDGGQDVPAIDLDLDLVFGSIQVKEQ